MSDASPPLPLSFPGNCDKGKGHPRDAAFLALTNPHVWISPDQIPSQFGKLRMQRV
jgi:hypothetical protein